MRKILYIVISVLALLAPVNRLDAAKLLPVEAVAIYLENGRVALKTDTENRGSGETAEAALKDLKENASGIIYLDTASFLLVGEGAEEPARELLGRLKRKVKVGIYSGGDVKEEAVWLDAHSAEARPKGQ